MTVITLLFKGTTASMANGVTGGKRKSLGVRSGPNPTKFAVSRPWIDACDERIVADAA